MHDELISQALLLAVDEIKKHEGFSDVAYADPLKGWEVPTIGYGRAQHVKKGDKTTREREEDWLKQETKKVLHYIITILTATAVSKLTPKKLAALACLVYNIGRGAFKNSTLRRLLIQLSEPSPSRLELAWIAWCRANGKISKGLLNRRRVEFEMFTGTKSEAQVQ